MTLETGRQQPSFLKDVQTGITEIKEAWSFRKFKRDFSTRHRFNDEYFPERSLLNSISLEEFSDEEMQGELFDENCRRINTRNAQERLPLIVDSQEYEKFNLEQRNLVMPAKRFIGKVSQIWGVQFSDEKKEAMLVDVIDYLKILPSRQFMFAGESR